MTINENTKIAPILKQNANALNAIISISPKFEKLRNPLLRKIMAGRTTLAMASKFGRCSVDDFYRKLEPLGFKIDRQTKPVEEDIGFKRYILDVSCKGETHFDPKHRLLLQQYSFPRFKLLAADGLIEWNKDGLKLTSAGHYFIRNICASFDLHR